MGGYKAQSAIEYLTTYGWAIIILSIVLAALFSLGVFSPGAFVSTTCVFPAEFGCLSAVLSAATGVLQINLQQSTLSDINITAMGCNNEGAPTNMITVNIITGDPSTNAVTIGIGSNYTFSFQCYSNYTVFNTIPGQVYKGYIIVNYTDLTSDFPHTVQGTLVAKAT